LPDKRDRIAKELSALLDANFTDDLGSVRIDGMFDMRAIADELICRYTMDTRPLDGYLPVRDVTALLNANARTVGRWADKGLFGDIHRTPGGHRRFKESDVMRYLQSLTAGNAADGDDRGGIDAQD
jgi:excisionase family DNA binding protein